MEKVMSILKFYAVSPIHAGSGASVATVDLPIQRERHTNYPNIQASSVKGAMRAHFREFITDGIKKINSHKFKQEEELINFIFGSDKQDNFNGKLKADEDSIESLSGAISVSDAKLFAFPMRSNVSPFLWATCPTVIERLKRDLELAKIHFEDNIVDFKVADDNTKIIKGKFKKDDKIVLEDVAVKVVSESPIEIDFIKINFEELENLLLISDEMFDYCVSNCTEIQTNIKIDSETGTAATGALRYQEFLPSDTLLYSVINFKNQAFVDDLKADVIKKHVQSLIKDFIQIGGDESLGKGICKINWVDNNN